MDQPTTIDIKLFDGIFVKSTAIKSKFTLLPQHSHVYAHSSFIATGSARVWKDDVLLGDFHAPVGILIEAKAKHTFMTLVDNTLIYCIHHIKDAEAVEIDEEHQLVDDLGRGIA